MPAPVATPTELASLSGLACEAVIPVEPDGLAAWRYRVPPDGSLIGFDPRHGRGQMWVVIAGDVVRGGAALSTRSCLFVFPDDDALALHAGAGGAELLCLQYPTRSAAA